MILDDRTMSNNHPVARPKARPRSFIARYQRRRPRWSVTINLTSMIDVVFLLLFFFLAASRFTPPEGMLPADLPQRGPAAGIIELPRTPLNIRLAVEPTDPFNCRLTIDRLRPQPMPLNDLAPALHEIRRQVPGFDARTPVYLVAADRVPWDHVVNAYNAALFAGFEKIYFTEAEP